MKAKTSIRLANDFENIIAIKEASNDMLQCMEIIKNTPPDFQLISGDDIHALPMISFGCSGVISVIAQGIPSDFTKMINLALEGDFNKASKAQFAFMDLIKMIFEENNPAGIKAVLSDLKICENQLRLPLVPVSQNLQRRISDFLATK